MTREVNGSSWHSALQGFRGKAEQVHGQEGLSSRYVLTTNHKAGRLELNIKVFWDLWNALRVFGRFELVKLERKPKRKVKFEG